MPERMSPRDFDNETDERYALIEVLTEWYPYPWQTWSRKKTNQLWAVYLKGKPHPKRPELPAEELEEERWPQLGDDDYKPLRIRENGIDYILSDSGEYVEIID